MRSQLLSLLMVLLISGCSGQGIFESTQTATPLSSFTPTKTPTNIPAPTLTPTPTKTPTPLPTLAGINTLVPADMHIIDDGVILLVAAFHEDGIESSPIRRGVTYAFVNPYHPGVDDNFASLVAPVVFYSPGAGRIAMERAKNMSGDEFDVCDASNVGRCGISFEQLTDGTYGRWAQKKFGDENHIVKIFISRYYRGMFPEEDDLIKALKQWETDLVLRLVLSNQISGKSWDSPILEAVMQRDPRSVIKIQNFADNADPASLDGDHNIYEFILPYPY
ncbi:MAG: hypothetical protein HZB19_10095 [Chloroflexi bacterium]|nr:hypothetical protein [Chloroflexota bacterium]